MVAGLALGAGTLAVPEVGSAGTGAVPAYDHVFVIVMGGQTFADVIGPAPYLTQLMATGATATAFQAVDASPLADQFAMTAGQTFGVTDCLPGTCSQTANNLGELVDGSGRTWKAYAESMPAPCATTASGDYVPEHVPWVYYSALAAECPTHVVSSDSMTTDLASAATTPDLAWIVPNQQNDMTLGTVAQGDAWAAATIPSILGAPAWTAQHSLLLVVFDSPGATAGYLPFIAVASDASVRVGYQSPPAYDHYNLLSTIESSWGLSPLTANDGGATAMTDLFNATPSATATPTPTATPPPTDTATPTPAGATPTPTPSDTSTPAPTSGSAGPTPTPSDGSTSTPTPTGQETPAPSPGATPTPSSSPTAGGGAAATPTPTPTTTPGPTPMPFPAPVPNAATPTTAPLVATTTGSNEFTITAPSMVTVGLAYLGTTTVASGGVASLPVMQFTATSITMASGGSVPSLTMQSPCTATEGTTLALQTIVPAPDAASLSGSVALQLTSLSLSYWDGTQYVPFTIDAATAPPPPLTLPPNDATHPYTNVSLVAASIHAGTVSLPNFQHVAFFGC